MPDLDKKALDELARVFRDRNSAEAVLEDAGFPVMEFPPDASPADIWREVERQCQFGVLEDPSVIVRSALRQYPGNKVLKPWLQAANAAATAPPAPVIVEPASPPTPQPPRAAVPPPPVAAPVPPPPVAPPPVPDRPATGHVVTVTAAGLTTQNVLDTARRILGQIGVQTTINVGLANNTLVALELPDATPDAIARLADQLANQLRIPRGRVSVRANTFRDYFLERVVVEGPDERQFGIEDVPASTPTREVARGVMNTYYQDSNWPVEKTGKPKEAVVTHVGENGKAKQVDAAKSLHENGVRDGDTLHVAPRVTAGGVNPVAREEALARVESQVRAFEAAHPGFSAKGNVTPKPTRYRLEFTAPGFAPADGPGAPRPVDRHVVELDLGPDFPMIAPLALWRTPVFHPNIHAETGKVCLGVLEEQYRPGMDFSDLCQMLVDIAGYQNYEVREGYNRAAQEWAVSPDGQLAIERRGGRSVLRSFLEEWQQGAHEPPPLRITPIE